LIAEASKIITTDRQAGTESRSRHDKTTTATQVPTLAIVPTQAEETPEYFPTIGQTTKARAINAEYKNSAKIHPEPPPKF